MCYCVISSFLPSCCKQSTTSRSPMVIIAWWWCHRPWYSNNNMCYCVISSFLPSCCKQSTTSRSPMVIIAWWWCHRPWYSNNRAVASRLAHGSRQLRHRIHCGDDGDDGGGDGCCRGISPLTNTSLSTTSPFIPSSPGIHAFLSKCAATTTALVTDLMYVTWYYRSWVRQQTYVRSRGRSTQSWLPAIVTYRSLMSRIISAYLSNQMVLKCSLMRR